MGISVLMSVYKKEKPEYLSAALESVIHQSLQPDEILVIKDGPLTTELEDVLMDINNNHTSISLYVLSRILASIEDGVYNRFGFSCIGYDDNKLIQKVVDEVLEELERIIQFYRNKSNSSIDKLYVFGGLSRFKNMDIYLGEKLNIKSSKINEIKNVNLGNDALFTKDLSLYLNAIGAIIRV